MTKQMTDAQREPEPEPEPERPIAGYVAYTPRPRPSARWLPGATERNRGEEALATYAPDDPYAVWAWPEYVADIAEARRRRMRAGADGRARERAGAVYAATRDALLGGWN